MRAWFRPARRTRGERLWWADVSSAALALLLAIVVWVVAVYEQDPPLLKDFEGVPVKYANIGTDMMLVGMPVDRVNLQARAPKSHWTAQALSTNMEVTADLEGLDEGVHTVDLKARSLDRTAQVVLCSPARVVVRLEQRIRREVGVQAIIADPDSTPLGYAAAQPKADPQKVTVTGPRSAVEQVSQVVAKVWMRSSKVAIEAPVALAALNAQGEPVQGVEISPAMVTVRLAVEALAEFREVTVRANIPAGQSPAAGYYVSRITVEPMSVTVQGKPEIIRQMAWVVSTLPVNITGVTETFSRRVSLVLPEGVAVYSADTSGHTVLVRVEVAPIMSGSTVHPKIQWLGLRSGYVLNLSPDTVDVILSGPVPELQVLQPEDVRVTVNVFGLAPGRYQLVPTVQLPDGSNLKVEGFAPDKVEVTITATARGTP